MPNPTPKPSPRQLAERIAEAVFTDHHGNQCEHMELFKGRTAYSWGHSMSKSAVIDRIVKVLEAEGR